MIVNQKIQPPWHLAQIFISMIELGILDIETITLSKNKMDSKVIKSHHCTLEKSYAVSIELNSELQSRIPLFR